MELLQRFRGAALLLPLLLTGLVFLGTNSSGNFPNGDDLLFFADRDGISMQQAQDKYGWHNAFSRAVEEVRAVAPDTVATARIENGVGVVGFKGEVPPAAETVINAFANDNPNVGVNLQANKSYTEGQIQAAVSTIHFALGQEQVVRGNVTYFHDASGKIKAEVQLRSTAPVSTLGRLQEIADSKLAHLPGVSAEVFKVDHGGPLLVDLSYTKHWGGETLGGTDICTSGFVVSNGAGKEGVTTAGHCDDEPTDDNEPLDIVEAYEGYYGDVQWHTGNHPTTPNKFYKGSNNTTEMYAATPT